MVMESFGGANPYCPGFASKRYTFCFKTMLQTQKTAHPCALAHKKNSKSIRFMRVGEHDGYGGNEKT